ncbi:hypothetical protein HZS_7307, partial [Henneguya salminicola]
YFSLKFTKNDLQKNKTGSVEIILANTHIAGDPITINYINNLIFKIKAFNEAIETISASIKEDYLSSKGYNIVEGKIRKTLVTLKYFILIAMVAFTFCTSTIPLDPVYEKISGFQKTQYLIGLNKGVYWLSYYLTDMIIAMISFCLCFVVLFIFKIDGLSDSNHLLKLYLSVFLFRQI